MKATGIVRRIDDLGRVRALQQSGQTTTPSKNFSFSS